MALCLRRVRKLNVLIQHNPTALTKFACASPTERLGFFPLITAH
jgi:hypothetical protein